MNHRQVQDLLPGYALGALETSEQREVSDHLKLCSTCYLLAGEQVDIASRLSGGIATAEPSVDLRVRVQASVANLPVPIPARPELVSAPLFSMRWLRAQGVALAASAACLSVLMLGVVLAFLTVSRGDLADLRRGSGELAANLAEQRSLVATSQGELGQLRKENQALATKVEEQRAVLATSQKELKELGQQNQALTARVKNQQIFTYLQALPVNHKFVLKGTQDAPVARGLLVSNPDKTWGAILLLEMDPLKPGTGYQIWLEKDGRATSTGIVKEIDTESGFGQLYVAKFPEALGQFTRVFVTLEPAAGSSAPAGKAVLTAPLR